MSLNDSDRARLYQREAETVLGVNTPRSPLEAMARLVDAIANASVDPTGADGRSTHELLLEAIQPSIDRLADAIDLLEDRIVLLEARPPDLTQELLERLGDSGELVLRRRLDR